MQIWKFFTSIRLGLVLILIIILLSLCSIFVVQAPQGISLGSSDFIYWLDSVARPDFGFWTDTLAFLGLFSVFHSPFFILTGSLLMINILCCTIKRLPSVLTAFGKRKINPISFNFTTTPDIRFADATSVTVSMAVTNVLMRQGYRVKETANENSILVNGDKYAFSKAGTISTHVSLILLVLGFILGSTLGFNNDNFLVAEGTMRDVGHNSGLSLGLVSFGIEHWPDGTVKEYKSQVVLYKEGQSVDTAIIRVNHPLSYNGLKFYQSYFGLAPLIKVTDAEGHDVASGPVALISTMEDQGNIRPVGRLIISGSGFTAYIIGPAINTPDTVINTNQVGVELYQDNMTAPSSWILLDAGTVIESNGLVFTYLEPSYFSVFKVKNEPGIWLVWLAFFLFTSGIVITFFVPYRRIYVRISQEGNNVVVFNKISGGPGSRISGELSVFSEDLKNKINSNNS